MLKIKLSKRAFKVLGKLEKSDPKTAVRIVKKIDQLSNKEIKGEPLQGVTDYAKSRVGKYRIITTIQDDTLMVFIIEKRETVYKTFQHLLQP